MKYVYTIVLLFCLPLFSIGQTLQNFHDFEVVTIEGDTISLSQYAGKKLLVVNTASYCGYTHQFNDLEALYEQYNANDFEILGFPCNDFGSQDPGADSTILEFCTSNYNVTFQMMSRIHIKTGDTSLVYKWLQRGDLNGVSDATVTWNFNKFLINPDGSWAGYYDSPIMPNAPAIVNWILAGSEPLSISSTEKLISSVSVSDQAIQLLLNSAATQDLSIRLLSITGQNLGEFKLPKGNTSFQIPTNLHAGIYLIQLNSGKSTETIRFVKS
jgi:glutathione peroxidase